jgi:DNA-binding transcriptional MocR family regulator
MVAQAIVAEFCTSGAIDASIATVKAALRERRDATCAALARHLPDAAFVTPEGGYFLWVDLPGEVDVAELAERAKQRGVIFVRGSDFLVEGGRSSLRIAYSGVGRDEIEEGIARLAAARADLGAREVEQPLGRRA